jgi:hypothetical protein
MADQPRGQSLAKVAQMSLDTARWQEAVRLWWEEKAADLAGAARVVGADSVYALLAASALEPLIAQVGLEGLPTALPDRFTGRDTRLLDVVIKGAGAGTTRYLVRASGDRQLRAVLDKVIQAANAPEAASAALGADWVAQVTARLAEVRPAAANPAEESDPEEEAAPAAGADPAPESGPVERGSVELEETPTALPRPAPTPAPRMPELTGSDTQPLPSSLTERDWRLLLGRIGAGKCTPFLGAGAAAGSLPLGADIANEWADQYDFPLENRSDLASVAQFLAIEYDPMFPKEELLKRWFTNIQPPDFADPGEPHGALASLPLPIYITTNYDSFMVQALSAQGKKPRRDYCRWNKFLTQPSVMDDLARSVEEPVVYHLHGHGDLPESLVLTEDDYLDFLVNVSTNRSLLPLRVQEAIAGTSLLFVGYRLADYNFRVMFRGLVSAMEASLRRISVTVQLPPEPEGSAEARLQQKYMTKYFREKDIHVYWGTAREFAAELTARWKEYSR